MITIFFEEELTGHTLMSVTDPDYVPNIGDIVEIGTDKHKVTEKIVHIGRDSNVRGYISMITLKLRFVV